MTNFGHELVNEFNKYQLMYPCVCGYMLVTKRQDVDSDEAYIVLNQKKKSVTIRCLWATQ